MAVPAKRYADVSGLLEIGVPATACAGEPRPDDWVGKHHRFAQEGLLLMSGTD